MNIWQKISRYWQARSIPSKFALGGRVFLVLILLVAATGYFSLIIVRKAEKSILLSSEIQRLVLAMDRGMEKSHSLYYTFLLQYPVIGFETAHQLYLQPSMRQIAQVIKTSEALKYQIEQSNVSRALRASHIDLNLYLYSARRFAETAIESVELITQNFAPERGGEARLVTALDDLERMLAGHDSLLKLFFEMKSHTQEYRIVRKRFLMQSAFNVSFQLYRQIEIISLAPGEREKIEGLLGQIRDIADKILETDLKIKSIINDFSLQQKAIGPISDSLVKLAGAEVTQARLKIESTHKAAFILMAGIALLGVLVAFGIGKLLNISITEKLVRLTKKARELRQGNLDVFVNEGIVDDGPRDEIGQLAATFNMMTDRMNALVNGLESKVDLRTKELQAANEKLRGEVQDRIKADADLAETQAILQAALDNSPAGIIIADAKTGEVQYINEVGLLTMDESKETIPSDFNVFTYVRKFQGYGLDGHPMEPGEYPVTYVIRNGKPISLEYLVKQTGRPDRFMWANAAPIMDASGEVKAGISIFLDITQRKKAEQERKNLEVQLRQAHKMEAIGTLAGGIAHDFNNLLAAIIGYADLANEDIPQDSPAKLQIEEVLKAGSRAKDLVKQILAFSRKSKLGRIPVQIPLVLKEVVHLLRASIPTTIDIRLDIGSGCRPVLADQTQIHQVILNLCTNAAQAMEKEGGLLEIRLIHMETDGTSDYPGLTPGAYVQLSVKDTGHGIEKQILDKIFDPYFTTKKIGKGSGMGLAMVHGIVKRHKGVIHVDSTPNVGSVFHVFLPASDQAVLDQNKKVQPLVGGSEHILVVDDEASIADMTRMRLERLGYTVTSKTSSRAALDLFCRYPDRFDLVITDQTMPQMTGEKMAAQMISVRKDIPIILSTGYSSRIDEEKTGQMGIRALLMKPVDMRELSVCIRRVLDDPLDIPEWGLLPEKKE